MVNRLRLAVNATVFTVAAIVLSVMLYWLFSALHSIGSSMNIGVEHIGIAATVGAFWLIGYGTRFPFPLPPKEGSWDEG